MPTGRVAIRSSWQAAFANIAVVAVVFVVVFVLGGSWTDGLVALFFFALLTGVFRYVNQVVLTPEGLEIRWLPAPRGAFGVGKGEVAAARS